MLLVSFLYNLDDRHSERRMCGGMRERRIPLLIALNVDALRLSCKWMD